MDIALSNKPIFLSYMFPQDRWNTAPEQYTNQVAQLSFLGYSTNISAFGDCDASPSHAGFESQASLCQELLSICIGSISGKMQTQDGIDILRGKTSPLHSTAKETVNKCPKNIIMVNERM
jgi:hypothetical protein